MRRRDLLTTAAVAIAGAALPLPAAEMSFQIGFPIVDLDNKLLGICRQIGAYAAGGPIPDYELAFFNAPPPLLSYWADRQMVCVEYEPGSGALRPIRMVVPRGA